MNPLQPRFPRPRYVVILICVLALLVLAPALQAQARPRMGRALGIFAIVVPLLAVYAAGGTRRQHWTAIGLGLACVALNAWAGARAALSRPPILALREA